MTPKVTATPGPHLIVAGLLIDGTGTPGLPDAAVLTNNGRIVAAGHPDAVRRHPLAGDALEHDFSECSVIPGLVDGHVHLGYGRDGDPSWAEVAGNSALYPAWALAAAQTALAAGVTTVRDCGSPNGIVLEMRRLAATGPTPASRVLACGPSLTTTGGHGEFIGVTADDAQQLRLRIRALAPRRPDAIKIMATGGSMDPHTNRRRAQYTAEQLRAAVVEAGRLGLHVVAHANATEGIRAAVDAGVRTIAHCNFLGPCEGRLEVDPEVVRRMAERGMYIDLNLEGAMVPLQDSDAAAEPPSPDFRGDRWSLLRGLDGLAERIFFTSDAFGSQVATFPELLAAAGRRWRLPAEEVVWRATGLSSAALQITADLGVVSPGKFADLVVLEGDLRTDLDTLTRPVAVFQRGVVVSRNGWLSTPNANVHSTNANVHSTREGDPR